ncbi:MarR family winged helix-turn-helix transcriptional regulator [Kutzneria sp. NPDC052558]|uniref:MarR family winged helix-turn-helix transcriptional regulator n=1 Tax=Kutzneria sp. NPDC052558 TaxID=3364121 RepID=UPI0037CB17B5
MTSAESDDAPWLTPGELRAWLSVVDLLVRLPGAIDAQLQRDSQLSMAEYMSLAMLSHSPQRTLRMSELAKHVNASLSRLSHLVKRLEQRGWIRRETDSVDARVTNAVLTDAGMDALAAAAPGHVRTVRRLVLDALPAGHLRRMGQDASAIVAAIDATPKAAG